MSKMTPITEAQQECSDFTPLTSEEAQALRLRNPSLSPWRVVAAQALVAVVVVLVGWGITGSLTVAWSAGFGALAVVIPGALFARGITGRFASLNAGNAVLGFFVWELVKILLTVAVMFMAYRVVENLSWPAMLVGLVVTMKVYWVALRFGRKTSLMQGETLNGKSN